MDWLQFLASIVSSLAWPLTLGVLIYLLRKPLLELLPNLRELKYKDLEVRFGEGLEKLEEKLEQQAPPEPTLRRAGVREDTDGKFDLLAQISPSAAVLEAWTDIERQLRTLAERNQIEEKRGRSILYITRFLRSREVLPPRLAGLLDDLRVLRNAAAHPSSERQITLNDARRYKEIADQVGDELQSLLE